jgi:hypothetical protein
LPTLLADEFIRNSSPTAATAATPASALHLDLRSNFVFVLFLCETGSLLINYGQSSTVLYPFIVERCHDQGQGKRAYCCMTTIAVPCSSSDVVVVHEDDDIDGAMLD